MTAARPNGPGDEIPEMTATELRDRLERGERITLIDVREPHERQIADLPDHGQRLVPIGEFVERLGEVDREAPVVLYCRTGSRSGWATRQLLARGHPQAWNLKGGLMAWKEEVDPSIQEY